MPADPPPPGSQPGFQSGPEPGPEPSPESGSDAALLEQLLGSLLVDFRIWFERGLLLLDLCPDAVMPADQRQALGDDLEEARKELQAAVALRGATPAPMALSMETMAPWHHLMLRVWSLSARLRRHGVELPPLPAQPRL